MDIPTDVQIALIGAVVIIVLVFIIKDRVAEVVFGPAKVTLFKPEEIQAATAKAKEIANSEAPKPQGGHAPKWQKVATLFWLGNDLMWIADMIYRGAPPERVLQGIDHSKQYFNDLGFAGDSFPIQQLNLATDILESLKSLTGLTAAERRSLKQHYTTVAQQVQSVKWYVSALAEGEEPGFKKLRAL